MHLFNLRRKSTISSLYTSALTLQLTSLESQRTVHGSSNKHTDH